MQSRTSCHYDLTCDISFLLIKQGVASVSYYNPLWKLKGLISKLSNAFSMFDKKGVDMKNDFSGSSLYILDGGKRGNDWFTFVVYVFALFTFYLVYVARARFDQLRLYDVTQVLNSSAQQGKDRIFGGLTLSFPLRCVEGKQISIRQDRLKQEWKKNRIFPFKVSDFKCVSTLDCLGYTTAHLRI